MTTATKPKQVRAMLPTRTSRAFKPLREVLEELESGKPLNKEREGKISQGLTSLVTYATYQSEKEKSGEDMTLERLKESADISREMTHKITELAKHPNLHPMAHLIKNAQSITDLLNDTCKRLEKRQPLTKPEKVEAPKHGIEVKVTKDGGYQIGNLIIHDQKLALQLMSQWVS